MDESAGSWKMSLPCQQAEAEAIADDEPMDGFSAILGREIDPADPTRWVIEAYLIDKPDAAKIASFKALAPSAGARQPDMEWIAPADWLTLSQSGLEPVNAGRFFVHTALHADAVPAGAIAFRIEAGQAFGTGQHETTTGCLLTLDQLKRDGARFKDVADIGTGTGLLAFAALKLWPGARVIASDIDPIAIDVARENAENNGITIGTRAGAVELVTAAGMANRSLRRRAPFDLIIANILAGPLVDLAPVLSAALAPGGTLILAGLLDHQAEAVANAYRPQGLRLADQIIRGEWPTLRLVKRRRVRLGRS